MFWIEKFNLIYSICSVVPGEKVRKIEKKIGKKFLLAIGVDDSIGLVCYQFLRNLLLNKRFLRNLKTILKAANEKHYLASSPIS